MYTQISIIVSISTYFCVCITNDVFTLISQALIQCHNVHSILHFLFIWSSFFANEKPDYHHPLSIYLIIHHHTLHTCMAISELLSVTRATFFVYLFLICFVLLCFREYTILCMLKILLRLPIIFKKSLNFLTQLRKES